MTTVLDVAEYLDLGGPQPVPLVGRGNIWIEDTVENRSSVSFTQRIVQLALEGTQPGQLEVVVFDDALSGLSAPFAELNSGGERILSTINDHREFAEVLVYLKDHVQGVNNVVKGLAEGLVDFRRLVKYPVEGYKVVVLSTDVALLTEEAQNHLSVLLRAGPRAGVSFVIHSTAMGVEFLADLCDRYAIKRGHLVRNDQPFHAGWEPPTAQALIASTARVSRAIVGAKLDPIPFNSIHQPDRSWLTSSVDGVTFAIGRYGLETIEITLGDEVNQRHNMLITGAVGQGKSNLLSVIIHSLCQRYSPAEVELYLLDFKEGVTLQSFVNNETGEYLPHARVLGLEADREFGLSVLRHLFALYRDRMRIFKAHDVQNLKQFRELRPDAPLPRIVVIVDEFQMMFAERDRTSDEIADLLAKGVRLFRACGVHIILASQTIGGNAALMGSAGEGLFGQVPVRVALKNSLSESHATLGIKNDAAVHLRAREAIVNVEYGELSANRKTTIAFADESVLRPMRREWWTRARATAAPPYVFLGERARSLRDDHAGLAEIAVRVDQPFSVLLGSKIDVDAGAMALPFGREVGRNIALLGAGAAAAEMANIAQSLAVQARNRGGIDFVVLELVTDDPFWRERADLVATALRDAGSSVRTIAKSDVSAFLTDVLAASELRGTEAGTEMVILGLGMDRCRELPTAFQDLCRTGPVSGIHIVGWWNKLDAFREHVGYGGENYFDTKIALRIDAQTAKQFFSDPLLEWRSAENRVLIMDPVVLDEPIRIIPYTAFDPAASAAAP